MHIRGALAAWLEYQRDVRRITPKSCAVYRTYVTRFLEYLERRRPRRVDQLTIDAWLGELSRAGQSESAVYNAHKTLRACCRWATSRRLLQEDPTLGVKAPIVRDRLRPTATKEHLVQLYRAIRRSGRMHSLRDATILAVLFYAGLRISECLALEPRDIDLEAGILRVLGKGALPAELPIHPCLERALRRWLRLRPPAAKFLFPSHAAWSSIYGRLDKSRFELELRRRYLRLAGLPRGLTPHAFRRGLAQRMKRVARAPITAIKGMLRHKRIQTTWGYCPDTPEEIRGWLERT